MRHVIYVMLLLVMGLGIGSIFADGFMPLTEDITVNRVVIGGILLEYADVNTAICAIRIKKNEEEHNWQDVMAPIEMCPTLKGYLNKRIRIAGTCKTYVANSGACLCLPVVDAVELLEIQIDPTKNVAPLTSSAQ